MIIFTIESNYKLCRTSTQKEHTLEMQNVLWLISVSHNPFLHVFVLSPCFFMYYAHALCSMLLTREQFLLLHDLAVSCCCCCSCSVGSQSAESSCQCWNFALSLYIHVCCHLDATRWHYWMAMHYRTCQHARCVDWILSKPTPLSSQTQSLYMNW